MVILWRLLFGHFLADFTFQPDYINIWKRSTLLGMLVHCLIHPITYAILVFPYLAEVWLENDWISFTGWQCVFFLFVLHLTEDVLRVLAIRKYRSLDNSWCFLWDQAVHVATIFLVIPVGAVGSVEVALERSSLAWETWPMLGCLLVLATHAGTILLYFLEKDFFDGEFPGAWEKFLGMGERLVLCLLCMVPGQGWPLLAAGWVWLMYRARERRILETGRFNLVASVLLAAACGLTGRVLLP